MEEDDSDGANIKFWSTISKDEEVLRPTYGAIFVTSGFCASKSKSKCLMVKSSSSDCSKWNSKANLRIGDSDSNSPSTYLSTNSVGEHGESCEKVFEKVHFILKSLNISTSCYDDELNELRETISELSRNIRWNWRKVVNLSDGLSKCLSKNEERRIRIETLESEMIRIKYDVVVMKSDNKMSVKQRISFCQITK